MERGNEREGVKRERKESEEKGMEEAKETSVVGHRSISSFITSFSIDPTEDDDEEA